MPPENGKGMKSNTKGMCLYQHYSWSTYIFLRRSAIKFTFLQKKTTTNQQARTSQDVNLWIIYTESNDASSAASCDNRPIISDRSGGGVVSIQSTRKRQTACLHHRPGTARYLRTTGSWGMGIIEMEVGWGGGGGGEGALLARKWRILVWYGKVQREVRRVLESKNLREAEERVAEEAN